MEYDVRLEQLGSRALAVVRRQASTRELPRIVPDACGTVWNVVRPQQVTGAGRHVAVYWDDQINLEVGVELAAPFAGHGEVVGSATPAGPVATTTHYGPYGQLHRAHEAIRRWCGSKGYALAGPNWEIYWSLERRMELRSYQDPHRRLPPACCGREFSRRTRRGGRRRGLIRLWDLKLSGAPPACTADGFTARRGPNAYDDTIRNRQPRSGRRAKP
ncbi:GyrI-like domain-containing protein [Paludisphaera borealis]|uniref:GyrI-like domain-containing protein n=1 Tax=Paludisphaera borealis TaxID=1387353 RepID=UPI001AEF84EC